MLQFVDAGEGVASLIHAVDIFVLTSRAEGVPTALLEAMTAGVPAVAMNVGSVGEAIVDGTTGLVVAAGDLGGFIAGVRMLASDRALRARMGAAAAVRAQAEFSTERCADRHVEAYTQALRFAGGPRRTRTASRTWAGPLPSRHTVQVRNSDTHRARRTTSIALSTAGCRSTDIPACLFGRPSPRGRTTRSRGPGPEARGRLFQDVRRRHAPCWSLSSRSLTRSPSSCCSGRRPRRAATSCGERLLQWFAVWGMGILAFAIVKDDFAIHSALLAVVTDGTLAFLWVLPSRLLAAPSLVRRVTQVACGFMAVEAIFGIMQAIAGFNENGTFDLDTGDWVQGTIYPWLSPERAFANPMFAGNMAFMLLAAAPLVVREKRWRVTFLLGAIALVLASVMHVLFMLFVGLVAAALWYRPSLSRGATRTVYWGSGYASRSSLASRSGPTSGRSQTSLNRRWRWKRRDRRSLWRPCTRFPSRIRSCHSSALGQVSSPAVQL